MDRSAEARQRSAETKRRRSRAAILAAAETLYRDRGWSATTTEEVASAAGVSAATVYSHFPAKASIAGALMRPHYRAALDPALRERPPTEALDTFVEGLVRGSVETRHLLPALVSVAAGAEEPAPTRFTVTDVRDTLPLVDVLTALVERGQVLGVFAAYPSGADIAVSVCNAILLRVSTYGVRDPDPAVHVAVTLVHRMVGLPDPV